MSGVKILITGVPGWLGDRLLEVLLDGSESWVRAIGIGTLRCLLLPGVDAGAFAARGVETVTGDVRDPAALAHAVRGIDVVLHLAGIIHAQRTATLFAVNTGGTRNLVAAATAAGVRRVVYISSNAAGGYQATRDQLLTEATPDRPYMAYGRSKKQAEQIVEAAQAARRCEGVILRPCWYSGPGQPERQTRFFQMIRRGNPLVFGDGKNLRSISYIDNVVQGICLAASVPRAAGQRYWIADEAPYATLTIYQTIARLLDVPALRPRHLPALVSTICRHADVALQAVGWYQQEVHVAGEMTLDIGCAIAKAKAELGYRPAIDLEEGFRRSIAWCRREGRL